MPLFGAIDLGASSGRVVAGLFREGKLSISVVHRFTNNPKEVNGKILWDLDSIMLEIRRGIRELAAFGERLNEDVVSLGVDTWAVDYGLVSAGSVVTPPSCYRDPLNKVGVDSVSEVLSPTELYQTSGLQFLPFNTIYQLKRQMSLDPGLVERAEKIVMLPDLICFLLTGLKATERTNASTTGLLGAISRDWDISIAQRLDIPIEKFPPLRDAGQELGPINLGKGLRLAKTKVVLVGSHDTASAVVGVPALEQNFAFLSSGTWSLLGTELEAPILSRASQEANFTNELGVDGTVRYLKNLSGLWLLSESMRFWRQNGNPQNLAELLKAAKNESIASRINVADTDLIAPGEMPPKINRILERTDQKIAETPAQVAAVILHSLAKTYAENLVLMEKLVGRNFERLFVIGGGAQNTLLCQLTADYSSRPVVAGPVEATAIGNLMVQVRAAGLVGEGLADIRASILASDFDIKTYLPEK